MIKRRKDYSKGTPSKTANKIYIVCEGKGTEPKYFDFFEIPDEAIVREFSSVKDFVDKQIAGGFDFQRDPVRLQDAIENSRKNFLLQDNGNLDWFATEVFKLGNEIMAFVHAEICKLKNKIG